MARSGDRIRIIPTALTADSWWDSRPGGSVILWRGEGSRHGISGEDADGLFGGGASPAGQGLEGCQPEPAASVAGGGQGREEP
jgi:hypothetical protein